MRLKDPYVSKNAKYLHRLLDKYTPGNTDIIGIVDLYRITWYRVHLKKHIENQKVATRFFDLIVNRTVTTIVKTICRRYKGDLNDDDLIKDMTPLATALVEDIISDIDRFPKIYNLRTVSLPYNLVYDTSL